MENARVQFLFRSCVVSENERVSAARAKLEDFLHCSHHGVWIVSRVSITILGKVGLCSRFCKPGLVEQLFNLKPYKCPTLRGQSLQPWN